MLGKTAKHLFLCHIGAWKTRDYQVPERSEG